MKGLNTLTLIVILFRKRYCPKKDVLSLLNLMIYLKIC